MAAASPLPHRLRAPRAWQTVRYGLDPEGFFASAQRRFGDLFTVRVLAETWVVVGDPEAVKEVFALGPDEANSGESNFALRPLIGTRNVLLLDGEEHLARRKLILPPFHGDRMRAYEDTIRAAVAAEIEALPLERPVPLLPHLQALTFSVIMRCVFGVDDADRVRRLGEVFTRMLRWITSTPRGVQYALLGPQRLMRLPSFRRQIAVVDREIETELALRRAEASTDKEDILSLLLQARDEQGRGLSDGELRDELATLLLAGHETTATLLAWAVHELARHEEGQARLAAGEKGICDSIVTETLRLHPPVPIVLRRLRAPATIAGHRLAAGTTLAPCMLLVHRRSDVYPEPWSFQPDRFLDRRPIRSEWFPFGGSVRRCVGAAFAQFEARIVLEELFSTLRISPDRPATERVGRSGPILIPGRGTRIVATRR